MGILDFSSKIISTYKADTSDHARKVRGLRGEEKKLAKEQLERIEKSNKGLDRSIAILGKVAVGVGSVAAAWSVAAKGIEDFQEFTQTSLAAAGADIQGIIDASQGMLSEMEAMSFAAGILNSDFALTQEEMETVVQGMLSLKRQGNDWNQVVQATTKALVEGNVRGLRPFGVALKATSGTADASRKIVARLGQEAQKFGGQFLDAGDRVTIAQKSLETSMTRMSVAAGKLAIGLTPLLSRMAKMVEQFNILVGITEDDDPLKTQLGLAQRAAGQGGTLIFAQSFIREFAKVAAEEAGVEFEFRGKFAESAVRQLEQAVGAESPLARVTGEQLKAFTSVVRDQAKTLAKLSEDQKQAAAAQVEAAKTQKKAAEQAAETTAVFAQVVKPAARRGFVPTPTGAVGATPLGRAPLKEQTATQFLLGLDEIARITRVADTETEDKPSLVERVFGTPEEIDAAAEALKGLTQVTTRAFSAWIDGTEGLADSAQAAIAEVLKALALEFAVRAIGAAAGGNFAGAAGYTAAAVAAGAAARVLGGGGAAPGTASASAGFRGGGVANERVQSRAVFVIGDDFGDTRARAARVRGLLDRADRFNRSNKGVVRV